MAQTSNKPTTHKEDQVLNFESFPVLASQTIYQNQLIALDSSGYAVPASDAASRTFGGVARDYVDNSTGASGDKYVTLYTQGAFLIQTTGSVAYGDPVYINSDEKVAASGSLATNGVFVGHALQSPSSNYRYVRLEAGKAGYTFPT